MTQIIFISILYLAGFCFGLLFKKKIPFPFICLSGFLWGSVFYAVASLLVLGSGIPYTRVTMGIAVIIFIISLAIVNYFHGNWKFHPGEFSWLVGSFLVFFLTSLAVTLFNFSTVSQDSYYQIMTGREMAFDGFSAAVMNYMAIAGPFMLVMQSAGVLIGVDYLYTLSPLFFISLLLIFLYICFRSIRLKFSGPIFPFFISLLAALAFLSSDLFLFQIFYIHGNLPASTYLFVCMGVCWLAAREENPTWLVFAGLSLIAFSLIRIEGILYALILLFLVFTIFHFAPRTRWSFSLPFLITIFLWYLLIFIRFPDKAGFLDRTRILMLMASLVFLGFYVFLLRYPFIRQWASKLLPYVVGFGVIILGAALWFLFPANTSTSLLVTLQNMFIEGRWGALWYVVPLLLALVFTRPRIENELFFILFFILYFVFLVALGSIREFPYHTKWYDSGNRMFTHILPIIFFYLVLKYTPGLSDHAVSATGLISEINTTNAR